MSLILPETENRTLEDIELHFADNSKSITDRKILMCTRINGVVKNVRFLNRSIEVENTESVKKEETAHKSNNIKLHGTNFDNKCFELESKV